METPSGIKKVKVVPRPRPKNDEGRYFMGVSVPLLGIVDEWAFYFEGEPWLYLVPDPVLSKIRKTGPLLKGGNNQWCFNFRLFTGCIEKPYECLEEFCQKIDLPLL